MSLSNPSLDFRHEDNFSHQTEFKLHPEILMHPHVPKPLHEVNPRNIMGKEKWDIIRQEVYCRSY